MLDHFMKEYDNPLDEITVDLGKDLPLYRYIQKAVQDIEVLNILNMYVFDDSITVPYIHVGNWTWNPHPSADEIQYRRRETGTKLSSKYIGNTRIGILGFDIACGARDKNKNLERKVIHNKIYVPIADEQGRYMMDNTLYTEYQLVDKLLYPSGKNSITLKSLLPIVISYEEATEVSIIGYLVQSRIGMVKIFTTMEPIISCFMHISSPLAYLGVFPILQFCDHITKEDADEFEYFQPISDVDIYIKAYRKGLEQFDYVRSILVMSIAIIRKHKPQDIDSLMSPEWWVYTLSYYDNIIEHRGACHEMHVARMLDTISAQVLPIPECDKRNMIGLLRYVLQTEFTNIDIYSFENKRLRRNEVISTIVTADVSDKLKRMYKFGILLKMKDMESILKFHPQIILNKMVGKLDGIVHVTDFTNDMDFCQKLKFSKKGPNSLGRLDKHRIGFGQRQLHPSMLGVIDLLESSKDVGQSGMISPWADLSQMNESNDTRFPNVKYELYKFITSEFPEPAITLNCDNIDEFNEIMDKLVMRSYINIDQYIEKESTEEE